MVKDVHEEVQSNYTKQLKLEKQRISREYKTHLN